MQCLQKRPRTAPEKNFAAINFLSKPFFIRKIFFCARPRTAPIRFDLKQRRRIVLGGFPAVKVPVESARKLVRKKKFSNVSDFFSAAAQLTFLEWILSTL